MPSVRRLLALPGVFRVDLDQCMFGLADPVSGMLYKKPTSVIGNFPSLPALGCKCDGNHSHEAVIGKVKHEGAWVSRSTVAGAYPVKFCQRICDLVLQDLASASHNRCRRLAQK